MASKTILKTLFKIITNHVYSLLYYHDPISSKMGQKKVHQNNSKWDTTFIFPFMWQENSVYF